MHAAHLALQQAAPVQPVIQHEQAGGRNAGLRHHLSLRANGERLARPCVARPRRVCGVALQHHALELTRLVQCDDPVGALLRHDELVAPLDHIPRVSKVDGKLCHLGWRRVAAAVELDAAEAVVLRVGDHAGRVADVRLAALFVRDRRCTGINHERGRIPGQTPQFVEAAPGFWDGRPVADQFEVRLVVFPIPAGALVPKADQRLDGAVVADSEHAPWVGGVDV